jgi:superfamily II DNA or RNA helicase
MEYKNRPCALRVSKLHPNAYTKEELVSLAVKKLKYTQAIAKRKTKEQICKELSEKKATQQIPLKIIVIPRKSKKISSDVCEKLETKKSSKTSSSSKKKSTSKEKIPKTSSSSKKKTVIDVCEKLETKKSTSKEKIPKIELHPHQIKIANFLKTHKGVVAAFSTGSGKTLTAIHAAYTILETKKGIESYKVLVISNVTLIDHFKKDMVKYGLDPNDKRFIFMTKEKFGIDYKNGKIECYNKMLIVDEAHSFRTLINIARKNRSNSAVSCSKLVDKILLLTATPIYNEPYDAVNLAAMIKGENPISHSNFDKIYKNNRSELEKYFKCIFSFYDIPKDDNYPTVQEHNIDILMTPEYQKQYTKIENIQVKLNGEPMIGEEIYDPLAFLTGMRQATNCLEPCLKTIWIISKLKEDPRKKTVIYSAFLERGVELLKEALHENKIEFYEISGNTKKKLRQPTVDSFNDPKNPNVLLITKTGGEGIDLKGVRNIIILESGYHRAGEEQIMGRGIRFESHSHLPKSQRHVDVYHLILKKMIPDPNTNRVPKRLSADEMLKILIEKKSVENKEMEKFLRKVSLENQKC